MLTFEKVLEIFRSFLAEGVYEIVMTSHGHTILEWDITSEKQSRKKMQKVVK